MAQEYGVPTTWLDTPFDYNETTLMQDLRKFIDEVNAIKAFRVMHPQLAYKGLDLVAFAKVFMKMKPTRRDVLILLCCGIMRGAKISSIKKTSTETMNEILTTLQKRYNIHDSVKGDKGSETVTIGRILLLFPHLVVACQSDIKHNHFTGHQFWDLVNPVLRTLNISAVIPKDFNCTSVKTILILYATQFSMLVTKDKTYGENLKNAKFFFKIGHNGSQFDEDDRIDLLIKYGVIEETQSGGNTRRNVTDAIDIQAMVACEVLKRQGNLKSSGFDGLTDLLDCADLASYHAACDAVPGWPKMTKKASGAFTMTCTDVFKVEVPGAMD